MATPIEYQTNPEWEAASNGIQWPSLEDMRNLERAYQMTQQHQTQTDREVFMERHREYEAEIRRQRRQAAQEIVNNYVRPVVPVLHRRPAVKAEELPPSVPFWNR